MTKTEIKKLQLIIFIKYKMDREGETQAEKDRV